MDVTSVCKICRSEKESIGHALFGCKRAEKICNFLVPREDQDIMFANNFADRMLRLANRLSGEDFEKLCITLWAIWNDRNNFLLEKPIMEWSARCEWIHQYWEETRPKVRKDTSHDDLVYSKNVSINVDNQANVYTDAVVWPNHVGVGFGVVIQRNDGGLQCVMTKFEARSLSPLAAEVQAIINAMRLLIRMQRFEAIIYSDSLSTI